MAARRTTLRFTLSPTLRIGLAIAMLTLLGACDQDNDSKATRAIEEAEAITDEALDNAGEMVEDAVEMAKETAEEIGEEIVQEVEEMAEETSDELARQAQEALEDGEEEIDSVLQGLKN